MVVAKQKFFFSLITSSDKLTVRIFILRDILQKFKALYYKFLHSVFNDVVEYIVHTARYS